MVTKQQAHDDALFLAEGGFDDPDVVEVLERLLEFIQQSQPVPEGFVLVPKDLTCAMVGEAHSVDQSHGSWPRALWQRLLAAAPKPGGAQ